MKVQRLDHLVLTVRDIEATCAFYSRVLGMEDVRYGNGRRALHFGQQKLNLHPAGNEYEPKADVPMPGSEDYCFITDATMPEIEEHLERCRIDVEWGPLERSGALGPMQSIYFRDPDGNLVEVSTYRNEG